MGTKSKWLKKPSIGFIAPSWKTVAQTAAKPTRQQNVVIKQHGYPLFNPLTAEWVLRALTDFTLSKARQFYSSMGNPLAGKGLTKY